MLAFPSSFGLPSKHPRYRLHDLHHPPRPPPQTHLSASNVFGGDDWLCIAVIMSPYDTVKNFKKHVELGVCVFHRYTADRIVCSIGGLCSKFSGELCGYMNPTVARFWMFINAWEVSPEILKSFRQRGGSFSNIHSGWWFRFILLSDAVYMYPTPRYLVDEVIATSFDIFYEQIWCISCCSPSGIFYSGLPIGVVQRDHHFGDAGVSSVLFKRYGAHVIVL